MPIRQIQGPMRQLKVRPTFHKYRLPSFAQVAAVLALTLIFCRTGWAQPVLDLGRSTGSPNAIYYGSNVDQVDSGNGNLRIAIPLLHLPGRGLDTDIELTYNSKIWQTIFDDTGTFSVFMDRDLGKLGTVVRDGFGRPGAPGWTLGVPRMGVLLPDGTDLGVDQWTFLSNDGTRTALLRDTPPVVSPPPPEGMWSFDGSFLRSMDKQNSTVIYRDGVIAGGDGSTLTDTNGNTIRCSWSNGLAGCIDTLKRKIDVSPDPNGLPGTLSYLDSSGTSSVITFKYTTVPLGYQFFDPNATCREVSTLKTIPIPLLTSVTLPNGLSYGFEYLVNWDGSSTGEITKMTLPAGGYVRYIYGSGAISEDFVNHCNLVARVGQDRMIVNRIVSSDGTAASEQSWSYSVTRPNLPFPSESPTIMTVTDPQGNSQVYSRYWPYSIPAQIDYKDSNGKLLKSVIGKTEAGAVIEKGIPDYLYRGWGNERYAALTTILADTNQQSEVTYQYGNYNDVIVKDEFDWGHGAPGPLLRETRTAYLDQSDDRYFNAHILGLPTSIVICSPLSAAEVSAGISSGDCPGNGALKKRSETDNTYDEANYLTPYPGIRLGAPNPVRGNLTTVSRWLNTSSSPIVSHANWYDTGKLFQTIDAMGNTTTYSYDTAYAGAYATQTCDALNHCVNVTYDLNTGLPTKVLDQNNQLTEYSYDGMMRLAQVSAPTQVVNGSALVGTTSFTYTDTPGALGVQSSRQQDSNSVAVDFSFFDGLSRLSQARSTDPEGDLLRDTTYDSLGRVGVVSNVYRSKTEPTYGVTAAQYADGLGRITQVTEPDGSTRQNMYAGSATLTRDEGNGTARVVRILQRDALNRVVSVCEVTSSGQTGGNVPSACNQEIPATGFLTSYRYDALDNLVGVQQTGETRSFAYDSLSRLFASANPESGTMTYTYDANGNVLTRTRPAPNQGNPQVTVTTSYKYDQLNRLVRRSYSDQITPTVTFSYDTSLELGRGLNNTIGRLSALYVNDAAGTVLSGKVFGYDPIGRVVDNSQCMPQNCTSSSVFPITYSFDLRGNLLSADNGLGTTISYSYDTVGRLLSAKSNLEDGVHPGTLFSATQYSPLGSVKNVKLGNGLYESFGYDTRGRLFSYVSSFSPPSFAQIVVPSLKAPPWLPADLAGRQYSYISHGRVLTGDVPAGQHKGSILISRSGHRHRKARGSVTVIITPKEAAKQVRSITVYYRADATPFAIASKLTRKMNSIATSPLEARAKQVGSAAVVELLSRKADSWEHFYVSVAVATKRHPCISVTASGDARTGQLLLGQLIAPGRKEGQ